MKSILCIGDVMLDVVVKFDGQINFDSDTKSKITTHGGGAAANTAACIKRKYSETSSFPSMLKYSASPLTRIPSNDNGKLNVLSLRAKGIVRGGV